MNLLEEKLKELNITDIETKVEQLEIYKRKILEWNKKVNLTAITNEREFDFKHFLDSLEPVENMGFQLSKNVIDVGTGAGFPGVPLGIIFPEKKFFLIDSLNKRLKIIEEILGEMDITNITVAHGRAEDLGRQKEYRERFDICVSRAVANLSTLSEYCLPFVKEKGTFIAYKSKDSEKEIMDARRAIKVLGGKISRIDEAENKSGLDSEHIIIYIQKIIKTPKIYPRKAGIPNKTPIK